jgi:hypothetical protein
LGELLRDRCAITGLALIFCRLWVNLSFAFCPHDSLADVLLSHLPLVLSERRCLMIEGRTKLGDGDILIGAAFTHCLTRVLRSTMCLAQQTTDRYAKMNIR